MSEGVNTSRLYHVSIYDTSVLMRYTKRLSHLYRISICHTDGERTADNLRPSRRASRTVPATAVRTAIVPATANASRVPPTETSHPANNPPSGAPPRNAKK